MTEPDFANLIEVTITKVGDKGTVPQHPVFEGYSIKALIAADHLPEVGKHYQVLRIERNGEEAVGIFTTSTVEEVGSYTHTVEGESRPPLHFSTRNSLYVITFP